MPYRPSIPRFLLAVALVVGPSTFALSSRASPPAPLTGVSSTSPHGDEAAFLAENEAAMGKMMADMAIKPTGDVDRDFVAMMVPHHQGAIDMAMAVLRFGGNEQLKRLAQEIIVTQQQEIVAMRLAVGELSPSPTPSPAQLSSMLVPHHHHTKPHDGIPTGAKPYKETEK